jgi:hypothetical protein
MDQKYKNELLETHYRQFIDSKKWDGSKFNELMVGLHQLSEMINNLTGKSMNLKTFSRMCGGIHEE